MFFYIVEPMHGATGRKNFANLLLDNIEKEAR